jgi:hypothetical protein
MALRQTTGHVVSLLRLTGLDWKVPDFSSICRCQKTLAVNIPYRGSKGALQLLIPVTKTVPQNRLGKRETRPSAGLCNRVQILNSRHVHGQSLQRIEVSATCANSRVDPSS